MLSIDVRKIIQSIWINDRYVASVDISRHKIVIANNNTSLTRNGIKIGQKNKNNESQLLHLKVDYFAVKELLKLIQLELNL